MLLDENDEGHLLAFLESIKSNYYRLRRDSCLTRTVMDSGTINDLRQRLKAYESEPTDEERADERRVVNNSVRYQIMRRDGFQCVLCGAKGRDAELRVDHTIPVSKGGKSTEDNLRTLCHACNSGKRDQVE